MFMYKCKKELLMFMYWDLHGFDVHFATY